MADLLAAVDVVLQIDLVAQVHQGRGGLEDHALLPPVGLGKLDLAIQPAGPEEGGIERVGPVRRHDALDVGRLIEAVHLVQELEEDALHLPVGPGLRVEALGGDGVHLVDEDDARGVLLGEAEDVADHAGSLAEVLLDEFRPDHGDEGGGRGVGDGLGHHGFAGPGRAVQEDAAGRVDADLRVEMVLDEGQLDGLPNLLLLDVHATDVLVGDVGLLGHELDGRVGFRGEDVDDGVRMPMEGDGGVGLEQLAVEGGQDPNVVGRAGGRRDDAVVGVDHFVELANDQRDGLDAGNLLLGPEQLPLQMPHLVLEVLLL